MEIKTIPGTKHFKASNTGIIFDKNGNKRNTYLNKDGYKTASVLLNTGKWQTFGVHRLVALAHLEPVEDYEKLTVNHKDGNINNNNVSNLEWISVANNNIHAILLRGSKDKPVIIGKSPEGKFEFISNLHKAAKKFNCDTDLVWFSILNKVKLNGWELTHYGNKTLLPNELKKNNFPNGRGLGKLEQRKIKILNIETQEVSSFESLHNAAKTFNVSSSHIFQLISTESKKKLFLKKYLIVDYDNNFPSLNQDEYESLLSPTGKELLAYNTRLKMYFLYESASKFIKENGLSKKSVTVDLRNNRLRKLGDWWYTYKNKNNIIRLSTVV